MPIRAVLLDLFDTLAYSDWDVWLVQLAEAVGCTTEELRRGYHHTRLDRNTGAYPTEEDAARELLLAAGVVNPDNEHLARFMDVEQQLRDHVTLFEDSLPAMRAMREGGLTTAVVSNCSFGTRGIVERLGLDTAADATVLSYELGARKPDPAIYRAALDALEVAPGDAVFVDDQTDYCDGARALGIDTRLILRADARPTEGFAPTTNGHQVITDLTAVV